MNLTFVVRGFVVLAAMTVAGWRLHTQLEEAVLLETALEAARAGGFTVKVVEHPYRPGRRGYALANGRLSFERATAMAASPQIYRVDLERWSRWPASAEAASCFPKYFRCVTAWHHRKTHDMWVRRDVYREPNPMDNYPPRYRQ